MSGQKKYTFTIKGENVDTVSTNDPFEAAVMAGPSGTLRTRDCGGGRQEHHDADRQRPDRRTDR